MASEKLALFGKTKAMEAEIDEFFDTVSQGGILFEETLRHFMVQGADDVFSQRQQQISEIESNGDNLVKSVVRALYTEMLIPESRADVLSLLQDIDHILDDFEMVCFAVDVERPDLSEISPRLIATFQDDQRCGEGSRNPYPGGEGIFSRYPLGAGSPAQSQFPRSRGRQIGDVPEATAI